MEGWKLAPSRSDAIERGRWWRDVRSDPEFNALRRAGQASQNRAASSQRGGTCRARRGRQAEQARAGLFPESVDARRDGRPRGKGTVAVRTSLAVRSRCGQRHYKPEGVGAS